MSRLAVRMDEWMALKMEENVLQPERECSKNGRNNQMR